MKNKTLLWVGIASAVLIGGGVFWWWRTTNPKTDDTKNDTKDDTKIDDTKKEEGKPADTTPKNTSASYPATPFKDKAQGNAFRAWMMKNHNDWRLNGDILDSSGDYDGTTIRKAYQDYGAEYAKKTAPVSSKSGFIAGNKLYIKRSVANVYGYPNAIEKNRLGYIVQSATSQATFKGDANTKGWVVANAKYTNIKGREGKKEVVGDVYILTDSVTNLAP